MLRTFGADEMHLHPLGYPNQSGRSSPRLGLLVMQVIMAAVGRDVVALDYWRLVDAVTGWEGALGE